MALKFWTSLTLVCVVTMATVVRSSEVSLTSEYEMLHLRDVILGTNVTFVSEASFSVECAILCARDDQFVTFTFTKGQGSAAGSCRGHSMILSSCSYWGTARSDTQAFSRSDSVKRDANLTTPDYHHPQYIFSLFGIDVTCRTNYTFKVKTCSDVHLALSTDMNSNNNTYEILLGGYGNTKNHLRRCILGCEVAMHLGAVVDCNAYKEFWVSWSGGQISVGQGVNVGQSVLMTYLDPTPYQVRYFGVSTGFGSTGEWLLPMY